MILNGDEIPDRDPRGRRIRGGTLMVLLHAGEEPVDWTLPSGWGDLWSVFADTAEQRRDPVDPAPPRRRGDHRHRTVAACAAPRLTRQVRCDRCQST